MSVAERCGSEQRSRYFPSRFASVLHFALSMRSSPPGGDPQVAVQAGLNRDPAAELAAFHHRQGVGPGDQLLELGEQLGTDVRVALGAVGVVADHEPFGVGDLHLLDPHVLRDGGVAALARQGGLDLRAVGAELLADDVGVIALAQVAAVGIGGEPAVGDPHDLRQGPVPHVVLDLADQLRVGGVSRPAPRPHRDPVAGDRHPDHDLR